MLLQMFIKAAPDFYEVVIPTPIVKGWPLSKGPRLRLSVFLGHGTVEGNATNR